jgi:hypothetical protein
VGEWAHVPTLIGERSQASVGAHEPKRTARPQSLHGIDGETQDDFIYLGGRNLADATSFAHQHGEKPAAVGKPSGLAESDVGRAPGGLVDVRIAVEPNKDPIAVKARPRPDEIAIHSGNLLARQPGVR